MNEKQLESFVGIDVSKITLDLWLEPGKESMNVIYDESGTAEVCARLKAVSPTLIVMEATGGLEARLAIALVACGLWLTGGSDQSTAGPKLC